MTISPLTVVKGDYFTAWAPAGIIRRLGVHDHAADPAPAVGTPAPARRWGDPLRPCITLSRVAATRSPPATNTNHILPWRSSYAYPRHCDTVPGDHRPDSRPAGAGHGALAQALGQRDGDTPQPLQPAVIPRHQYLAPHGHGLCIAVLGDVPPGQSRRGEHPEGGARGPCRVLEGL